MNGNLRTESVLFTIVPGIPNRAPGMSWAVDKYLSSDLMDTHFVNGEPDWGILMTLPKAAEL